MMSQINHTNLLPPHQRDGKEYHTSTKEEKRVCVKDVIRKKSCAYTPLSNRQRERERERERDVRTLKQNR